MMKFKSKKLCRGSFKFGIRGNNVKGGDQKGVANCSNNNSEIKWELRPGGMLVQRRDTGSSAGGEGTIVVRVSTVSQWQNTSIEPTSTFGELKMILSLVTSMEPREQRVLFKGKEREDGEYLHMVGVGDKDKVVLLLLQDPAIQEMKKLRRLTSTIPTAYRTISV
ncbi:early nodulin-like protein 1-like [Hibiscus syriacus]|uniref:Early nodulin-like protein 1-like n=1 Tax=Hibiscus syriacus TaxID=106335 RepID=A0A6A3BT92_HIBSY|nr:BAG family molecular chaperone regulator 2-like [Hibiscus syriacus]KAE8720130.1 early nodulin-like protein 1-like [Hibiscus syriacus]